VDCSDNLALSIIRNHFGGHLLVHVVNEVVVGKALWLSRKNFINDMMQVFLLDLEVSAHIKNLVAPAVFTQEVVAHRVKECWTI